MLDYPVLRKKPQITIVRDGETFTMSDLLSKTYIANPDAHGLFIKVTEEYIARPDLISLAAYGVDDYGDMICKANGISNPFEVNEGMLLFIPYEEFLDDSIVAIGTKSDFVNPKSKINSNGMNDNIFKEFSTSMLSNDRLKELVSKENIAQQKGAPIATIGKSVDNVKKLKNERRSPAEQTIDDENFIVRKDLGIVIY